MKPLKVPFTAEAVRPLTAPNCIAVLKALTKDLREVHSITQLSKATGIEYTRCVRATQMLEEAGYVTRRKEGREVLVGLNGWPIIVGGI